MKKHHSGLFHQNFRPQELEGYVVDIGIKQGCYSQSLAQLDEEGIVVIRIVPVKLPVVIAIPA